MDLIFALVCTASVTMPICPAVKLMAGDPIVSIAIATSEMVTCSPVASNWSISRLDGLSVICAASDTSWSVDLPIADTTMTT